MKVAWKIKALSEVCQFKPTKGEARLRCSGKDLVSFLPMEDLGIDQKFFVAKKTKTLAEVVSSYTYFSNGDVLLAKITPCFENGKLGIARNLTNGIGFGSSEYIVLRPHDSLDKEWLYYFLSRDVFRKEGAERMNGAVGHKRVSNDFVESIPIPIPPLPEQQRIVGILDEAFEGIATAKANAEQNLRNARALVQPTFMAIFNSFNHCGWRSLTVEGVARKEKGAIRTGPFGSQLLHSEFVDTGIPVLGIDNAVQNRFTWNERRYIAPQKFAELSRYQVKPGDVLITIMGTCGRCAIVPDDISTAINSKHLCCITLDHQMCLPEFLHAYFLYHPISQGFLSKRAKGAIMAGLNMGLIKELPLLLPPIDTQRIIIKKISEVREYAENIESLFKQKVEALESLKKSILHQAFSGNL